MSISVSLEKCNFSDNNNNNSNNNDNSNNDNAEKKEREQILNKIDVKKKSGKDLISRQVVYLLKSAVQGPANNLTATNMSRRSLKNENKCVEKFLSFLSFLLLLLLQ